MNSSTSSDEYSDGSKEGLPIITSIIEAVRERQIKLESLVGENYSHSIIISIIIIEEVFLPL